MTLNGNNLFQYAKRFQRENFPHEIDSILMIPTEHEFFTRVIYKDVEYFPAAIDRAEDTAFRDIPNALEDESRSKIMDKEMQDFFRIAQAFTSSSLSQR